MGLRGYHFGDYRKLELPLSLIVAGLGASEGGLTPARLDR
jgi:hypothetical protein